MFTDRQSLYLIGILTGLFFLAGLNNLLDYLIVKIVLGCLFCLILVNLVIVTNNKEKTEDS